MGGGEVHLGRPLGVRVRSEGRIQRLMSREKEVGRNHLAFQRLLFSASTAEGPGSYPAQGTDIPQAAWHDCAPLPPKKDLLSKEKAVWSFPGLH